MELYEYMDALADIDTDELSDDELDRLDASVRAIMYQMDWIDRVKVVR